LTFAFSVLDAWGKFPPAGMLSGNFQATGAYWECHDLGFEVARYCNIRNPAPGVTFPTIRVEITSFPALHVDLPFILSSLGVCIPASCNQDNFIAALNASSSPVQIFPVNGTLLVSCDHEKHLSTQASVVIGVLGLFAFLGIGASVIYEVNRKDNGDDQQRKKKEVKVFESNNDVEQPLLSNNNGMDNNRVQEVTQEQLENVGREIPKKKKNLSQELVEAFAVSENLRKLFTVSPTKPELDKLRALDGIRVLSLLWVILGHTYMFFGFSSGNSLLLTPSLETYMFSYQ
jgi:hypothetical protein